MPAIDPGLAQLGLAEVPPCPGYGRDYVKLGAWLFAFLFGPALVAITLLLA